MRLRPGAWLLLLCAVVAWGGDPAPPPGTVIALPTDSGAADLRRDYGAKGDGVSDDTAAIRAALAANIDYHCRPIYVPPGIYLVSDTLEARKPDGKCFFGTKLIGHSQQTSIIRLKDRCPGFGDPGKPKHVIRLCSRDQERGGNMGHWNSLINLTIDTGTGNRGAAGIDYIASNEGSLRDITVRSGDGSGTIGIDMTAPWPGPCLLNKVTVLGFDVGIATAHGLYSITFKDLVLQGQKVAGLRNDGNMLCMLGVRSRNVVPAISGKGTLVLLRSALDGGASDASAIEHDGPTYIRRVTSTGYSGVKRGLPASVAEWVDQAPVGLRTPDGGGSLDLAWEDTPVVPYEPGEAWRNGGGSSASVQAAIDSGASTVYIPWGEHHFDRTVVVRGAVRRIVGMYAIVHGPPDGGPIFRFENGAPAVVEFMNAHGWFQHASRQPLVVRQCNVRMGNTPECGPLFVEDNCSDKWELDNPQRVYLYQFNPESPEFDLKVKGAHVFCLGFKSEREGLQVAVSEGGAVEILGGVIYPCHAVPQDRPMFQVDGGALGVFVTYYSYIGDGIHRIKVREQRGGAVADFTEDIYGRLYLGFSERPKLRQKREQEREAAEAKKKQAAEVAAARRERDEQARRALGERTKALGRLEPEYANRLYAALRIAAAAGRGPMVDLTALKSQARVLVAAEGGALELQLAGGGSMSWTWGQLSAAERAQVAKQIASPQDPPSLCTAAYYLALIGRDTDASMLLSQAGVAGQQLLQTIGETNR